MKLSGLERKVVRRNAVHRFGNYLQTAYLTLPGLVKKINRGEYPLRERVTEILNQMDKFRVQFDKAYCLLSTESTNPLQVEQEAWKLLSPKLADCLTRFIQFTNSYSPDEVNEESIKRFSSLVEEGYCLLQKWNIISNSNKPKYEMSVYRDTPEWNDEDVQQREEAVRELIKELSSTQHKP